MLLNYTKIIGMPVAELRNQEKIGVIGNIIFNDECAVAGFMLGSQSLFFWKEQAKVIPAEASIALVKDGLIINSDDNICDLSEMVRLNSLIKRKLCGIHQRVLTERGKYLGYVYDFLINSSTLSMTKFYIKNLLFEEKIIPCSKVLSFDKGQIIVKDESKPITVAEPMAEIASN